MSDIVTAPAPGWYDDPMTPAQQRWWSGIGWTEHTQPVPVPVPVAVIESVVAPEPSPAPQPFAEAAAAPAAPMGSVPLGAFGGFESAAPAHGFGASGGFSSSYGYEIAAPPLENPRAKTGLILSTVSLLINPLLILGILGIVNSVRGLRRAREIESMGHPNSRRGMATAGLVLGILSTLIVLAAFVIGVERALPHYDQTSVEAAIAQDVQTQSKVAANVSCPASESVIVGATFECTVTLASGGAGFAEVTWTDSSGRFSVLYSATSTAAVGS